MNSPDIVATAEPVVEFDCNICGAPNTRPEHRFERETPSCRSCGSTVRTRAIMQMLTRELFGADFALTDLPRLKGVRGIGFSDSVDYADRLASIFDYRNTYYHKDPQFDITNLPEEDAGAYDFVISSEVFEHVPPPPETAFGNAFRLLKPNGVFLMTVPYTLGDQTREHFPDLYDYGLAQLSDRIVLVNRTRNGRLQVFEDLAFHGGGGSTLEMRCFTENDLRAILADAGFSSVQIYGENYRPFGIIRTENWSLPMAGRKAPFALRQSSVKHLMEQWTQLLTRSRRLEGHAQSLEKDYQEYVRWATARIAECEAVIKERTEWAQRLDGELQERTGWALSLEKELREREAEAGLLRVQLARTRGALWTKAGRALRLVP